MSSAVQQALVGGVDAGTVILFPALGELISQRAGVINLGTEGALLAGALTAFAVASTTMSASSRVRQRGGAKPRMSPCGMARPMTPFSKLLETIVANIAAFSDQPRIVYSVAHRGGGLQKPHVPSGNIR